MSRIKSNTSAEQLGRSDCDEICNENRENISRSGSSLGSVTDRETHVATTPPQTSSSSLPSLAAPSSSVPPQAQLPPFQSSFAEEKMRRKLQFFFMNPIEKWQAKRRFPYKFVIQLIKIVLVTMQLCLFAHYRYNHVNYTGDNKVPNKFFFLNVFQDHFSSQVQFLIFSKTSTAFPNNLKLIVLCKDNAICYQAKQTVNLTLVSVSLCVYLENDFNCGDRIIQDKY